jgi:hypothetical protein
MTGSKRVDHWTSGTVCQCSEIAGSGQFNKSFYSNSTEKIMFSPCMYMILLTKEKNVDCRNCKATKEYKRVLGTDSD